MSTCLVLVDIQEGFLNHYTKPILDKLKILIEEHGDEFDHIVATRFINYTGSPFTRLMNWNDLMDEQSIKLDTYVESISERVFDKKLYTCFNSEFKEYLEKNEIDKLFFAGIDTDCCVLKSAVDCFENNIYVEVILNVCASTGGPRSDDAAKLVLERLIGANNLNNTWCDY